MCLILFAYKMDDIDLVVAANRDEFYHRPTAPAHFWDDTPNVLGGRDLEKMGTWMGITRQGRFAALTNYRNPAESTEHKRSRGEVVSQFLTGQDSPKCYMRYMQQQRDAYPGYNLIVGDMYSLYYYSNVENEIRLLPPGLYGLSNHLLDTPWPKVQKGKEGLKSCLEAAKDSSFDCLFATLQQEEQAPDEELPSTGVSLDWERKLSPLFIQTPDYGTRSSAVLLRKKEDICFIERVYADGVVKEREFSFSVTEGN
ncbi:NRDE family protein [Ectobacillus funiculus]|uniref:NRDE family protein n=1 Tax=Ectobacillus funiculus TaxID=137993 RepID=UPI0039785302